MSNNTTRRREAIDTLGLVVVKHSTGLTPQGRARDAAGLPTSAADEGPIEALFEIEDGETVGELLARVGLDEGDRVEIRFPTQAEDAAKLARLLATTEGRVA